MSTIRQQWSIRRITISSPRTTGSRRAAPIPKTALEGATGNSRSPQSPSNSVSPHVPTLRPKNSRSRVSFRWISCAIQNGIREKRWKLAKYYDVDGNVPPQWEMYDLKRDPLEKRNIAHRGEKRTPLEERQLKRLRKKLERVERTRLSGPTGP